MVVEQIFIQTILPKNYGSTQKFNGVYCYCKDDVGMTPEDWDKLLHFLKIKYAGRFINFNFTETIKESKNTNRHKFTIYLKP